MSSCSRFPDHSVTLFDKGFWGAELLSSLNNAGSNCHWLIPAKKGIVREEVIRYSLHDRFVRMKVSPQPGSEARLLLRTGKPAKSAMKFRAS